MLADRPVVDEEGQLQRVYAELKKLELMIKERKGKLPRRLRPVKRYVLAEGPDGTPLAWIETDGREFSVCVVKGASSYEGGVVFVNTTKDVVKEATVKLVKDLL